MPIRITLYYKRGDMTGTESQDETCVWLPPRLGKKLAVVARALHCTTSEAASLAVHTQLEKLEAMASDRAGRDIPAAGSGVPQK